MSDAKITAAFHETLVDLGSRPGAGPFLDLAHRLIDLAGRVPGMDHDGALANAEALKWLLDVAIVHAINRADDRVAMAAAIRHATEVRERSDRELAAAAQRAAQEASERAQQLVNAARAAHESADRATSAALVDAEALLDAATAQHDLAWQQAVAVGAIATD